FFAGTLEKAPEWMEKASLEWLFRLVKEPRRLWRRYILGGIKYIYYTIESK
ncbi:TPA: WecB/TagA/CpsF family glycosyltransferase, partial [Enterococcus faecium]|nr:WecB/TagA/CpsF family glycosyltransferase [Enterococcus faecium]